MSRGLVRDLPSFCLVFVTRVWPRGAPKQHLAGAGARGGAVKTGPLGPPVGAALTGPGLGCRQPPCAPEPRRGSLVAYGVDGHSSDITCSRTERAGRGPAA